MLVSLASFATTRLQELLGLRLNYDLVIPCIWLKFLCLLSYLFKSSHRTFLSRSSAGFQMGFLSLWVQTIEIRVWLFGFIGHFIDPKVAFHCVSRFALCAIDKYTYDNNISTYISLFIQSIFALTSAMQFDWEIRPGKPLPKWRGLCKC